MDVRQTTFLFMAAAALLPMQAPAQEYPSKPIRFIAPQPPGGGFDYTVRVLAERLQGSLGQAVIVENRPGAGTVIGSEFVARQPPDGYTLLMGSDTLTTLPSLAAKLPFDPVKDFTPISTVATPPFVLVVSSSSPIRTVNEYIAAAKAKPGSITFGSSGVGTPFQFAGELMKSMANIDMLHVPYRGSAQIVQALLTGELASTFAPLTPVLPHIASGKLRALASSGTQRMRSMPQLPTVMESGVPGYDIATWFGLQTTAGVPRPIIERLNREVGEWLRLPETREKLADQFSLDITPSTPEQMAERIARELPIFTRLMRASGIEPE